MRLASLKPAYAVRRLSQIRFSRRMPEAPWLTQSAVLLLHEWLKPEDRGIEWGSGRSTLWFASRVASLFSIEHDPHWYAHVTNQLRESGVVNKVDYHLVECTLGTNDEPEAHPYADIVDQLDDNAHDFALVDGRIRLPCIRQAMRKLRVGGILILDNANCFIPNRFGDRNTTVHLACNSPGSEGWREVIKELRGWRWIGTTDGIWDTRMWIKQSEV